MFRALHVPGRPVVLPNVWDAASAKIVAEAGFPAVATASAAVAPMLGYGDHEGAPGSEMLAAAARIAGAVDVPVTVDLERGYGLPPDELAARLAETGAVGCNLEDTAAGEQGRVGLEEQIAFLAAFRAADSDVVLNARVDSFLLGGAPEDMLADAIERGRRYVEAGADCIYPMALSLPTDTIKALVDGIGAPVNVAFLPGANFAELAATGAARITFGPGMFLALRQRLRELVTTIATGADPYTGMDLFAELARG